MQPRGRFWLQGHFGLLERFPRSIATGEEIPRKWENRGQKGGPSAPPRSLRRTTVTSGTRAGARTLPRPLPPRTPPTPPPGRGHTVGGSRATISDPRRPDRAPAGSPRRAPRAPGPPPATPVRP